MTQEQSKTLVAIRNHFARHDYSPSLPEIAAATGKRSLATVHKHVKALAKQERIGHQPGGARTISLTPKPLKCVFHLEHDALCPACGQIVPADTKHECNGQRKEAA